LVLVLDEGLEFVLFTEDGAHGFGFIKGEAALVESSFAVEGDGPAGGGVGNFGEAGVMFATGGDSGGEIEGVEWFGGAG
jgi:hypothetical protein